MTTLSILIPHFNDPEGFRRSLESVRAQKWQGSRQVIVCDDGSTESNYSALRRILEETQEPAQVTRLPANRGRPYARNILLEQASGRFTTWLDAGDLWYPEKVGNQLDALYRHEFTEGNLPVWCTCHYDWQWDGGRRRLRKQEVEGNQASHLLTGRLAAYLWTTIARTEHYKNVGFFDTELPRLQDLDFFLRFVSKGGSFVLPSGSKPLCIYMKSDIGRDAEEIRNCFNRVLDKHTALLMRHSRAFRRNRQSHVFLHAARFAQNNEQPTVVAKYLGRALCLRPIGTIATLWKTKGKL